MTQNTKDPFDRKSLAQRLGCSQTSLSNAVITRFLKYLPSAIKNLNEAYDDQNMKKFFAGCHSLKGASGTVSANELHEVLKTIDAMKNLDYILSYYWLNCNYVDNIGNLSEKAQEF